ncbi:MAG: FAD-dependent monooxygenase [Gammaproteobacteria bacterium]|nr:FAD-dependent monooxygenase [Gammaproteobacteria bacterium]
MNANLFIAADGTNSTCRDLLGISHDEKNDGDIACIYQLQLSENHNHRAFERFTKLGVLAVLPLFDENKAQLVWTITPEIAKKIADWPDDIILEFLQNTFEGRLEIISVKKSAQFPLKITLAEKQITESAVLLGNSAHTIYPVAAQGFNLGLHDVGILSDILIDALKNKKNINDQAVLKNYEIRARKHQEAIFSITNKLTPLFDLPFIGGLRGLGLLSMDLIKPVKNRLAKRTMGMRR